jgi:hypothetical protein
MQAGNLSAFYEVCKGLELARNFQFPVLREVSDNNLFVTFKFVMAGTLSILNKSIFVFFKPPQSFLTTMEEYMRDAPQMVDVTSGPLLLTYTPDDGLTSEDVGPSHEEHETSSPSDSAVVPSEETQLSSQSPPSVETPQNFIDTDDLLGLHDDTPDPLAILDQNALALALVSNDGELLGLCTGALSLPFLLVFSRNSGYVSVSS